MSNVFVAWRDGGVSRSLLGVDVGDSSGVVKYRLCVMGYCSVNSKLVYFSLENGVYCMNDNYDLD